MVQALRILTAAAALALAIVMIVFGYISWWFAPVMLAWNIGPLLLACSIASREQRPGLSVAMLIFAAAYIAAAVWIYRAAFSLGPGMNGFAYLLVPFAGWAGLPCVPLAGSLVSWIRRVMAA